MSLAAFAPRAPFTSPLYLALALFDFFTLWFLVALGLMVARAGRLKPATAVGIPLGLYFLFGGALVAVRAALAP